MPHKKYHKNPAGMQFFIKPMMINFIELYVFLLALLKL
jgi:hypothetical protein